MIAVVGEALVDVVVAGDGPPREHPGGSPANVALGLARLGHDVTLTTQLAADVYGTLVRRHLEASGVRLDVHPARRTSTARASVDASGVASYTFDLTWDVATLDLAPGVDAVHTGSLATLVHPGASAVERLVTDARAAGVLVSFDPNARPALVEDRAAYVTQVESVVGLSHVVKVSEEDLAYLYPDVPEADRPDAVATRWRVQLGPDVVVVTLGADGALAVTRAGTVHVPGRRVDVVDTVGAGDAFSSGLLDGLAAMGALHPAALAALTGDAVTAAVQRAVAVAAVTCSRPGADPPTSSQLEAT